MGVQLKSFRTYLEESTKEVVVTFGRFNPPTIGHEKLFKKLVATAGKNPFRIYSSQSTDPEKNPLEYEDKVKFLRKIFPAYGRNIILDKGIKTILQLATQEYENGTTHLVVVAGGDRISEYKTLLPKYNGVKGTHGYYNFKNIKLVNAGDRDDGSGVSGMSASKMRSAAADNDLETFAKGLPKTFGDVKDLFNAVRKGMGLKESHNFRKHVQFDTLSEQRERYISGQIFNVGDTVIGKKDGCKYTIESRGPNYVTCTSSESEKGVKFFIHDIMETVLDEKSETWESGYERRVVKVTDAQRLDAGYKWRITGKDDSSRTIKYYKEKPDFEEYVSQMKRIAGHEFETR